MGPPSRVPSLIASLSTSFPSILLVAFGFGLGLRAIRKGGAVNAVLGIVGVLISSFGAFSLIAYSRHL